VIQNRGLRHYLRQGGVIAYPTESCFGLGCDPKSRLGVQRILRLKGRPQHKGLILIAHELRQFAPFISQLSASQKTKLLETWPGPFTWLIPASKRCPLWLRGKHSSIAVRVTAHTGSAKLAHSINNAIVSTSANRSGHQSAKSARECSRLFGKSVRVISGRIGKAKKPSTIKDLVTNKVIRP